LIFFIESTLILLVFKKYKKIKKNQIDKKRKKVEGPILTSMQHFTYKYWSTTQTKGGGAILTTSEKNTKKPNCKPIFFSRGAAPHVFGFPSPAGSSIFFFPQTSTIFLLLLAQTQPAFPVCHPPNTSSEGRQTSTVASLLFFPLHRLLLQKQRLATPLCPLVSSSSSSDGPSP
jgi:hypothetical protein